MKYEKNHQKTEEVRIMNIKKDSQEKADFSFIINQ